MIRILHLINTNGFLGGAERHLLSILQRSDKERIENFLCCITRDTPDTKGLFERAKALDSNHAVLSHKNFDFAHIMEISRLVEKHNIDILHCHGYKANFLGLIAAKLSKKPVIATIHGWTQADFKLKLYKMLDLIILRLFDKIIIVSDRLKLDIKKAMIPDTKIQVIYNGINPAKFNFIGDNRIIKERLAIPLHYKVVGIVGRLAKEKGHIYFLQAAKYILREYGDVYFLIIGDGPLRRNLEITAKKMCITDKVAFTGYQENPMEFLSLVDIFVVSSKNEGLPLSLLEAMAMKKAVVAFGVGAIPQVLEDGLSGIIVKPGDWRSLAINILNLLKNDKKRSDFGENSRRIIEEKYTDSRMVNSLETVYENL